ncbi:AB hydrolase superfamily protein B1A11.02 [Cyphellophora attinorum]|uniref:AB hydrolase superfamily protein B1A11.02 n=1 Tax=Cyphellophora attinorum TaxID=1664694 RepID=A0A0N1H2J7_9EURO|nr:AB hydrolase superfamily protein B1A11.02 [Phialophora attinorum]KPI34362.1 AB hydrolase superfamily protein B1A11.02 [Phialophora attinorum]
MAPGRAEMDKVHPELEKLFAKTGPPPPLPVPTRETVGRFRTAFNRGRQRYNSSAFVKSTLPSPPTWKEHDIQIPVRDGTTIPTRIYTPPNPRPAAVVFFHGGGWFMGDLETEAHDCQLLCARLGVAVFNVAYRLYPDVAFPVPIYDAYDAVKYIAAEYSSTLNLDRGFIVAGSSGGATFASIVCHFARDEGLKPALTGCHVTCPIFTDEVPGPNGEITRIFGPERYASQDTHANGMLQNRKMKEAILKLSTFPLGKSQLLSPLHAENHANLPPAYVQVCGLDPWRDGGIIYAEELEKEGVRTKVEVFSGLPHVWWTVFPMLKISRVRFEEMVKGMDWLLRSNTAAKEKL